MGEEPHCPGWMLIKGRSLEIVRGCIHLVDSWQITVDIHTQKDNTFCTPPHFSHLSRRLKVLFLIWLLVYSIVPCILLRCAGQYYILFPAGVPSAVHH